MLNERYKTYRILFDYIVLSLSISMAIFQGDDDRNYMLIGSMMFGPIIFLISFQKILKIDRQVRNFMLLLFFIPVIFNLHSIKWSSLMFTYMFLFYFLAGIHCAIKGRIDIRQILRIVQKLIFAYAIVLILQQICVILGLPILNESAVRPEEPWKLNSLSAEPSHTSRIIGILMYVFISIQNTIAQRRLSLKESYKKASKVWIAFLWVTLTTVSGTAMIVVCLILSMFITKKLMPLFIGGMFLIIAIGAVSSITALNRASVFIQAVLSGNADQMVGADHSASVRVVPWILCLQRINPLSFRSWVGEGAGSVSQWMYLNMPGVPEGWTGGGTASMLVEYGIIVGIYYLIFSFKACYSKNYKIATIGLWIISILLVGINMQVAWLCILMLFIVNNIRRDENKSILQFT